eukprot:Nitzschia sp. Nitz4//scaffold218_size35881//7110//8783//NITZ4_007789-RA/size35881-processed-gene-0.14-mRNA-1//-1//CDS//3329542265//35//frame0
MHIRLSEEQGLGSCSNQWRSSQPATSSGMSQLQGQTECPSSPLGSIPRSMAVVSPHAHDDSSDSEESQESLQVAEILSQLSRSLPVRNSATNTSSCSVPPQSSPSAASKEGSVTLSTSKSIVHSAAHEEEKQVALALVSVSAKSRAPRTAKNGGTEKRVQFLPNLVEGSVSERPTALPPLRPIAGLSAYDVLLGEAMVSHAHTGNRRLLVLAWNGIVQGSRSSQSDQVDYLYSTLLQASGRFLVYQKSTKEWAPCEPEEAKRYLTVLVGKLQTLKHMSLLHLFLPDYQSLWDKLPSDAIKVQAQAVPIASKNIVISPLLPAPATSKAVSPTILNSDLLKCPQVSSSHQVIKSTIARASTHLLAPICKKDTTKRYEPMTPLAKDFTPGPNDVICSRGKPAREHSGNRYFITLIEKYIEKYTRAVGKLGKSMIVTEILDTIRQRSPNGGFVKLNANGQWCEAGDHLAREKIGQCFRDRLHTKYSSSSKAKLVKRRQRIKGEKANGSKKSSSAHQGKQDDMDTSDASVASSNVSASLSCGTPMDKASSFSGSSSAQISCQ